jgi:hypothetical protein
MRLPIPSSVRHGSVVRVVVRVVVVVVLRVVVVVVLLRVVVVVVLSHTSSSHL